MSKYTYTIILDTEDGILQDTVKVPLNVYEAIFKSIKSLRKDARLFGIRFKLHGNHAPQMCSMTPEEFISDVKEGRHLW